MDADTAGAFVDPNLLFVFLATPMVAIFLFLIFLLVRSLTSQPKKTKAARLTE